MSFKITIDENEKEKKDRFNQAERNVLIKWGKDENVTTQQC